MSGDIGLNGYIRGSGDIEGCFGKLWLLFRIKGMKGFRFKPFEE